MRWINRASDEKSVSTGRLLSRKYFQHVHCKKKNKQCNWNVACMCYKGALGLCVAVILTNESDTMILVQRKRIL